MWAATTNANMTIVRITNGTTETRACVTWGERGSTSLAIGSSVGGTQRQQIETDVSSCVRPWIFVMPSPQPRNKATAMCSETMVSARFVFENEAQNLRLQVQLWSAPQRSISRRQSFTHDRLATGIADWPSLRRRRLGQVERLSVANGRPSGLLVPSLEAVS